MDSLIKSMGFSNFSSKSLEICDACLQAKHTRNQFANSENKAEHSFELIHCNIWGPYRIPASCDARYFLTLIDDASRVVWLYLMREKSEAGHFLKAFVSMAKNSIRKKC